MAGLSTAKVRIHPGGGKGGDAVPLSGVRTTVDTDFGSREECPVVGSRHGDDRRDRALGRREWHWVPCSNGVCLAHNPISYPSGILSSVQLANAVETPPGSLAVN